MYHYKPCRYKNYTMFTVGLNKKKIQHCVFNHWDTGRKRVFFNYGKKKQLTNEIKYSFFVKD